MTRWFGLALLLGCADAPPSTVPCGAVSCASPEICLEEWFEPACEPHEDTDAACPDGTTASQCGGAGLPCCCGATPPVTTRCYLPDACDAEPTCACVSAACPPDKSCTAVGADPGAVFRCEPLAVP